MIPNNLPKVTFGIIVLNGEPFIRYCLRALYPFAHEIIVVEGASEKAASIATPKGHSRDETLEVLYRFRVEEDPENKLTVITAEDEGYPNGFWPGEKDEQSQAYAKRAAGDYLWQVDIDEFYKPEDMETILNMLQADPHITAVSFKQLTFWGGFDYVADSWYLRRGAEIYHRLFKWGNGYKYVTHRPPTVCDTENKDLRSLKWANGYDLEKMGIYLYHYSLVFPKQVIEKCDYYSSAGWATHAKESYEWAQNNYMKLQNPYRVHNVYDYPSWLMRYNGEHPPTIQQMKKDIESGALLIKMRDNSDVEQILNSKRYVLGSICIREIDYLDRAVRFPNCVVRFLFHRLSKFKQRVYKNTHS